MFDKRESDTIQRVALDMDGLATKNIFRALLACYRAGYRHAEDDCNVASLELNGSEGTWIEQDQGLVKYEAPHLPAHAQPETTRNSPRAA
jgi:hypothetical protein